MILMVRLGVCALTYDVKENGIFEFHFFLFFFHASRRWDVVACSGARGLSAEA